MIRGDMAHRQPYQPGQPVAFLHIPKSAGSSLTGALIAALTPRTSFASGGIDRCMFGTLAFDRLQETARRLIVFDASAIPDVEFLTGHLSLSVMSQASPQAQFITVLREPTSRLISLWLFLRSFPSSFHEAWGPWSEVIRLCYLPLRDFLLAPQFACQTDNQTLRMLLWPHPLIPDGGFIDERHDRTLLDDALSRLERFSFVDVVENPALSRNLSAWLGRPLVVGRNNETGAIPEPLKIPLAEDLDLGTSDRIASSSRLDAVLWSTVVRQQLRGVEWQTLRAQTLARNLSNYSRLVAAD
jgi:hypothetical protein